MTPKKDEAFDRSKPVPKDWYLRQRLLTLGVQASVVAAVVVPTAAIVVPNPFVNGV